MANSNFLFPTEAEEYVIGSALISPECVDVLGSWLEPSDFSSQTCKQAWEIMLAMSGNTEIDVFTVGEQMQDHMNDLVQFASSTPSAANVTAYAEIVKDRSNRRRISDAIQQAATAVHSNKSSVADVSAILSSAIANAEVGKDVGLQPIKASLKGWFNELVERFNSGSEFVGRSTPWKEMNERTRGLRPGDLIIIGARPAMGKSVVGFGLAAHDAMQPNGRTAVFSLEMTKSQFIQREVSALAGIENEWLRFPTKDRDENWSKVVAGIEMLNSANLLIDDTPRLTVHQIRARAKRAHAQSPLSMVVVDHIHIIKLNGKNTVAELGEVSGVLKQLAKEIGCPVVALAQLNRDNTKRLDQRPTMADLRGSGDIEQDADAVFLLHRDEYYNKDSEFKGILEVIVGKGRDFSAETIYLESDLKHMRFKDMTKPIPDKEKPVSKIPKGFD